MTRIKATTIKAKNDNNKVKAITGESGSCFEPKFDASR
jgi:hypothetical protein